MPEESGSVPVGLTVDGLINRRYAARCIDTIIISLLVAAVLAIADVIWPRYSHNLISVLLVALTAAFVWLGYGALLESSSWQATLGKRIVTLRVYNSQARRVTILQAAGRNVVKDGPFILFALLPGGRLLAFAWLVVHLVVVNKSPFCQAIHDHAAKTWVAAPEETTQLHLS
jgi:uncharacterized RDD family membrane protein YckC